MLQSMRTVWAWLRPKLSWFVGAAIALLTLGLLAKRRERVVKVVTGSDDAKHLADALRPSMKRRAENALKEAEEHRAFAEERIEAARAERARVDQMSPDEVLKASHEYARRARARKAGKTGALLVLLSALSAPLTARAEDPLPFILQHPKTHEFGWWIPDDVWRSALADAHELLEMHKAVERYQASIAMRELAVTELQREVEFERGLADVAHAKLRETNQILARERKWYRSPKFLIPLGIVLGAAAVVTPTVLLR